MFQVQITMIVGQWTTITAKKKNNKNNDYDDDIKKCNIEFNYIIYYCVV